MADAEILRGGKVVRNDNFTNDVKNDLDGFLVEFTLIDITYFYREASQFRRNDFENQVDGVRSGYFKKDVFLEYLAGQLEVDINMVKNSTLEKDHRIKDAIKDDLIKIKSLLIQNPYDKFYENVLYTFPYDGDKSNVLDSNGNIRIPELVSAVPYEVTGSTLASKIFYENRRSIIGTFPALQKDQVALVITKIALVINMINKDIFPSFNVGPNNFSQFTAAQNEYWQTGNIFVNYTLQDFNEYLINLLQYYRLAYANQKLIRDSESKNKLFWLANVLSIEALGLLTPESRLEVLEILALKNGLDNSLEEFALKIINSIDINNQTTVNKFLGELINKSYPTNNNMPPYSENLYSLLYKKLENYNPVLKSSLELIGNYNLSKDNKTRYVQAILLLWTESKYNPYKNLQPNGEPDYSLIDNSTYDYDKSLNHFAIINYESKKNGFGVYEDDFIFEFDPWARGIYWVTENKNYSLTSSSSLNIYQPITITSYQSETDVSIQIPQKDGELNGVIPLFYLAYLDKDGDQKDFYTKVGVLVDVVATFSGIGNIAKLRHLRYLSRLGQVLVVIETIQISAAIMHFLLNFSEACDDSPFCKKLKTALFFIEITALVTDPIAMAKAKKSAQNLVEEGIENGWPSGMLDEIDGVTPQQKIQEIAGIDITEYLERYVSQGKKDLLDKISKENDILKSIGSPPGLAKYYSNSQIEEILTFAASKGLSKEDGMGILHQACRIRKDEFIASIPLLKTRMDNLVIVRKRRYPFTFEDIVDFDLYATEKIGLTLDKFGLSKDRAYYTGSSITSQSSTGGGVFDTDWAVNYSRKQLEELMLQIEAKYREAFKSRALVNGKTIKESYINVKIKDMRSLYSKKGFLHKRYIVAIEDGNLVTLEEVIRRDFPDVIKTDITPIIEGFNVGYPRIKYNFN